MNTTSISMRLLCLLILLSFLPISNDLVCAQSCEGSAGVVIFPATICTGSQSEVEIGGLDVPEDYAFQLYLTTSPIFDPEDVIYQSDFPIISDEQLPAGTYYLFSAISPAPINPADPCFTISTASEFLINAFELEDIPDTVFTTCDNPVATVVWSNDSDVIYGYNASLNGISIVLGGTGNSFSSSTPGTYRIIVSLDGFECSRSYTFEIINSDFVLPQVVTFDGSCDDTNTFCLSPYDPTQTYTLDGQVLSDSCFAEPSGSGPFVLEIERPGCNGSTVMSLTVEDPIVQIFYEVTNASCGAADGEVAISVQNGTFPIDVNIVGEVNTFNSTSDTIIYSNLPSDFYGAFATDAIGCTGTNIFFIGEELPPLAATVTDASGPNTPDGSIVFDAPPPNLTFDWTDLIPSEDTQDRTGLLPGTYFVNISDETGCFGTQSFVVGSPCDLEASLSSDIFFGFCDTVTLMPEITGGTLPLSYFWVDDELGDTLGTDPTITLGNEADGFIVLTVEDALGCTDTAQALLQFEPFVVFPFLLQEGSLLCQDSVLLASVLYPVSRWEDSDGNTVGTEDTLFVTASGNYTAYLVTEDNPNCNGGLPAVFEVYGGDAFEVIIAPGLPCQPPTFQAPFPGLIDHQWTDLAGNLVGDEESITILQNGTYVYTGTDPNGPCTRSDTFEVSFSSCQTISGAVWIDEGNCLFDGTETALAQARLAFRPVGGPPAEVYYTLANTDGAWSTSLPVGQYSVEYDGPITDLYFSCPNQEITVTEGTDTDFVDVLVNALEDCPRVSIDLAVPLLRRCFESTIFLSYRNTGSLPAENASVEVVLDDFLLVESADFPFSMAGQVITFELGDLAPQQGGLIQLVVTVSCDAELGQTHCIQATATPNAPCPTPDMAWMGGTVDITLVCDADQSRFEIENIGESNMTVPLSYIVVEDGVMFREEPFTEEALAVAQTVSFTLPDPEKSYWIQSNQEPFSPGDPMPTAFTAGCVENPDGTFTNQFGNGDETYWYEEVCLANIGAYDPNDKTALPVGYGSDRFIEPGTPIDYLIRFQNTGTDTAFNVRLVDTLDTDLDLSTFEVLSASHDFRPELDTSGVLTIYFDNIMLPDSNVDFRGSNGFFSYRIQPSADLELPFVVTNRAGIYFDFNEPIITNTVLHTVDTGFIAGPNSIGRVRTPLAELKVSPNPSPTGQFWLEIETWQAGPYLIRVTDKLGRIVLTQEEVLEQVMLDGSSMPSGSYQLSVFDRGGRWLATQQIIR